VDPARSALILYGASEAPIAWEIKAPDRLRLLDRMGEPIVSELPYELSGGPLEPTPLELFQSGMFTYLADAATFEECLTGHRFPVAAEGERPALERAYLEARPEPGAPVLAALEGRIEIRPAMEGPPRRTLIVERFIRMHPEGTCPSAPGGFAPRPPELTETYWRLVRLDGMPLEGPAGRREPYLLLLEEEGQPRFTATAGCNMLNGGWSRTGDTLTFGPARATRMACPPPIAAREQALSKALAEAASWSIAGETLTLEDEAGSPVLKAEAAYTRF
jgi:copper homeostasis protein (lipoprotein)